MNFVEITIRSLRIGRNEVNSQGTFNQKSHMLMIFLSPVCTLLILINYGSLLSVRFLSTDYGRSIRGIHLFVISVIKLPVFCLSVASSMILFTRSLRSGSFRSDRTNPLFLYLVLRMIYFPYLVVECACIMSLIFSSDTV